MYVCALGNIWFVLLGDAPRHYLTSLLHALVFCTLRAQGSAVLRARSWDVVGASAWSHVCPECELL